MKDKQKHPLVALIISQSLGVFNDNAWKIMVFLLAVRTIARGPFFEAASQSEAALIFLIFTLPLVLFSLPAGVVADRFSKKSVIVLMKAVEFALMAAASFVLSYSPQGGWATLLILSLMGVHSAFLSPAKYGIIPEILPHAELSKGNGVFEMFNFFAIIAGQFSAGLLLAISGQSAFFAAAVLAVLSLIGFAASFKIPPVKAARKEGGLVTTFRYGWGAILNDRVLRLATIGSVFFWAVASFLGQNILVYAKSVMALPDSTTGLPLAAVAVGTGIGALLAGKLSRSKVEYGLLPLGAVGLMLSTLIAGLYAPGAPGIYALMAFLGCSGGLVLVPLNSIIQWRSDEDKRGAVISIVNTFVFGGVVAGSLAAGVMAQIGLDTRWLFLSAAIVVAAGTIWVMRLLPDAFLRLILVILTNTFYRLKVAGIENIPEKGGALLVPNHVSFVDGLLILASIDRPVRFLVYSGYYHLPVLRFFMRLMGAIPVSSADGPRAILRSLRDAGKLIEEGEIICIFPEGQMTRTGMLLPFRRGFERIVKGRNASVIPVYLDRVWGSIFSFSGGRYVTKLPEKIPYPVTVSFGAAMPSGASVHDVRRAVQDLGEKSWQLRKTGATPLHHSFIRSVRRRPFKFAFADHSKTRVSRFKALVGTIALARALRPRWKNQKFVGVLLPPSVGGALVNIAAAVSGHASVNLNYTSGKHGMDSAVRQAGLTTLVSSRAFIERAKLESPENIEIIWLEDVAAGIGRLSKLVAMILAIFAPIRLIEKSCGSAGTRVMDDIATVIFSSGSTGEPKGVELSHFNIHSNVEAVSQVFPAYSKDRLLGILPFFHSFGYTATLWLAAIRGIGVVFHPTPLDAKAIGALVERYRITMLIATPTFLQLYLKRCSPEQFGSLRVVLTGAEKLSERLAQAFEDNFGIRPMEGYGATECSPVIAVSNIGFRAPGQFQKGARRGHVGQPVPGMSVRVVDPETFEPLLPNEAGMLLVKGPNVMKGYLGRDDLTKAAIRDGWYVTGDIAVVDDDGFIRITDRLARFSKIGGEMVPHGKIEEVLHEAAGSDIQVFAVTGVPDEKKGEKLAVLHVLDETAVAACLEKVASTGLPNIFIPKRDAFIKVDKLPVLGTGKMDLKKVKQIALERLK